MKAAISNVRASVVLLNINGQLGVGKGGSLHLGDLATAAFPPEPDDYPIVAYAPPLHPNCLGHLYFKRSHNLRYAYVIGAMANGISSVEMVEQAGQAGMLGFFGAAGLTIPEIDSAITQVQQRMSALPYGFNLIHSPNEPELESATVDLYLKRGVKRVSASAYLDLTLPLVYFRSHGISRDHQGRVICPNQIVAKVSRREVAQKFFSPPPDKLLKHLVTHGMITEQQAMLAKSIPMADDLTAEADSGGHTDNQPAISLLPTMRALRDELAEKFNYDRPLRVGLAGGIATPDSAAAAFAMGADYVLTGSINQACLEAGTSDSVRSMLAQASQADVSMAPAADMFEMGVKVQVLKRGTMFPFRAAKLYDLYCKYDSLEELPAEQKIILERDFFRRSFEEEWEYTQAYFDRRDPTQIQRAASNPKHKMALVFRSYLGRSSSWANTGEPSRKIDYQIWCGPAIGAFNEWVKGSFLEKPENRRIVTVAMNILYGAAVITRINWIRSQCIPLDSAFQKYIPQKLSKINEMLREDLIG
ncbi:MAG: PfaD family polyunsaturated fatty acid/polyketide biosynthesis protein [Deltaproteobacteria bacterium]|nr:MAG: PfaD family polyunsaturated fatty acid/polyketide biosynthesis protein [Deltaproteobacteria bacterium]